MGEPVSHVEIDWLDRQRVHVAFDAEFCVLLHKEEFRRFRGGVAADLQGFIGVRTGCCWERCKGVSRDIAVIAGCW